MSHVSDEQISSLIDGELSLTAREAVGAHLRSCPACAARHDAFVSAVAALRLSPALVWRESLTEAVTRKLPPRGRNLALPIAAVLSLVALLASAAYLAIFSAGLTVAESIVRALGSFVPSPGGTSTSLGALIALALFGPLISIRLSRWR